MGWMVDQEYPAIQEYQSAPCEISATSHFPCPFLSLHRGTKALLVASVLRVLLGQRDQEVLLVLKELLGNSDQKGSRDRQEILGTLDTM